MKIKDIRYNQTGIKPSKCRCGCKAVVRVTDNSKLEMSEDLCRSCLNSFRGIKRDESHKQN